MKRYSRGTILMLSFISLTLFLVIAGLPAMTGGTDIPGTVVIKYIEKQYSPVTFDHARHASLAGSCGRCHHEHIDTRAPMCVKCHSLNSEAFKSTAIKGFHPCSACHKDYSPETPNVPGFKTALHKTCFECHMGIKELGTSPAGCVAMCHTRK